MFVFLNKHIFSSLLDKFLNFTILSPEPKGRTVVCFPHTNNNRFIIFDVMPKWIDDQNAQSYPTALKLGNPRLAPTLYQWWRDYCLM
jgi:hypothetical protein